MNAELNECANCNEWHIEILARRGRYWAVCHDCGRKGDAHKTKGGAIQLWNEKQGQLEMKATP